MMPVAYGKVPYGVADAGGFAGLNRAEAVVYLVLAAHVNGQNWTARPSVARIAELAGLSQDHPDPIRRRANGERSARRILQRLAAPGRGLIAIEPGGGRSCPNTYRLLAGNPDRNAVTLSTEKPGPTTVTLWREKPGPDGVERVTREGLNPDRQGSPEQQNSRTADKSAGASAPASARSRTKSSAPSRRKVASAIIWTETNGFSGITEADRGRWVRAYPACDIDRQLASMDVWLRENPAKAHKSRWGRFIANWLSHSQDRGGDVETRHGHGREPDHRAEKAAREHPEPKDRTLPTL